MTIQNRSLHKEIAFSTTLALAFFAGFMLWLSNFYDQKGLDEVKTHANVIAEHVWNIDKTSSLAYLQLAVTNNNYKSLKVKQTNNSEPFMVLKGTPLSRIESFLASIYLIQLDKYTAEIIYEENLLGEITVEKWSKHFYILANVLLLELLLIAIYLLYQKIIWANKNLEQLVTSRTKELIDLNKELKTSEKKFRSFSEQTLFGILVVQNDHIIYVNKATTEILEVSSDKLLSYTLQEAEKALHFPMGSLSGKKNQTSSIFPKESVFASGATIRYKNSKGETKWFEIIRKEVEIASSYSDQESQSYPAELIYLMDITFKMEAEQVTARLTSILEMTSDLVITFNPDLSISFINKAGLKLLGWSSEQGKDLTSIYPPSTSKAMLMSYIADAQEKGIWHRDTVIQDLNQKPVSVSQIIISHFDEKNDIKYLSTIIRDITERKKFETEQITLKEQLNSIINSMLSALITINEEGLVIHWNKAAEMLFGFTADAAINTHLESLMPEVFKKMDILHESMQQSVSAFKSKVRLERNKKLYYLDLYVFPLESLHVKGAVIRIDDITEKVRLEEMMVQSEKMLSIGGLAAGMAHEINNPLAAILQNTQVIRRRISPGNQKNDSVAAELNISMEAIDSYLEKRNIYSMMDGIMESGARAAKIISNMLSFSRKSDSDYAPQHLNELMDQTIELAYSDYSLKKEYDFKKIIIQKFYGENLVAVNCEKSQIQQVLLNLLKNGAQAMADKSYADGEEPTFKVTVEQDELSSWFEIEDNGPGISDDIRKRIFEPFYTTKPTGTGTGLGLSVSYFIISENHKGTMEVFSNEGEGTRFLIKIPNVKPVELV